MFRRPLLMGYGGGCVGLIYSRRCGFLPPMRSNGGALGSAAVVVYEDASFSSVAVIMRRNASGSIAGAAVAPINGTKDELLETMHSETPPFHNGALTRSVTRARVVGESTTMSLLRNASSSYRPKLPVDFGVDRARACLCTYCGTTIRAFNADTHLNSHLAIVLLTCSDCNEEFIDRSSASRHINEEHGGDRSLLIEHKDAFDELEESKHKYLQGY